MYKTIHFFTDLQDFKHPYNPGDEYPRKGLIVSEKRIEELASSNNRRKKPLIRLVEDEETTESETSNEEEKTEIRRTKTEINRMNKADLVSFAESYGIPNDESLSAAKIKESLIQFLGL